MNFFEGAYKSGEFIMSDFKNGRIAISGKHKSQINKNLTQEKIIVGIRPEHLKLKGGKKRGEPELKAKIISYEPLGAKTVVYLHPDANSSSIIKSTMESDYKPQLGEFKYLDFEERNLYLFDKISTDLVQRFSD